MQKAKINPSFTGTASSKFTTYRKITGFACENLAIKNSDTKNFEEFCWKVNAKITKLVSL